MQAQVKGCVISHISTLQKSINKKKTRNYKNKNQKIQEKQEQVKTGKYGNPLHVYLLKKQTEKKDATY